MTTEKIYYKNGMNLEFYATVISCIRNEERDTYESELDTTGFFPGGGGQDPDTGIIYTDVTPPTNTEGRPSVIIESDRNDESKRVNVISMKEEKNGRILHITDKPLTPGSIVYGVPDREARLDRMQQHTAEHIVSGIIHKMYGFDNVGFHLGDSITTLDFNGYIEPEGVRNIEDLANEAVWSCIDIISYIPSREELAKLDYRSKMEIEGDVRIVNIPGIDTCACCAPHMDHTGRVGLIKIVDSMRHRGGIRITILAGKRALCDYRIKEASVYGISALISEKPEKITGGVQRLLNELQDKRGMLIDAIKDRICSQVDAQLASEGSAPVAIFTEHSERTAIKLSLEYISSATDRMGCIYTGNDETGYSYAIVAKDRDLKAWLTSFHERFPGKGGGRPEQVNGSVKALKCDIEAFLKF